MLLDEFQDCTSEQYDLIKEAFLGSGCVLTAVGDTKQRIMGFAGAMEGVFEQFVADFNAHAMSLYQNHRSAVRIGQEFTIRWCSSWTHHPPYPQTN